MENNAAFYIIFFLIPFPHYNLRATFYIRLKIICAGFINFNSLKHFHFKIIEVRNKSINSKGQGLKPNGYCSETEFYLFIS